MAIRGVIVLLFAIMLYIGVPIAIFFAIKALIRYNAKVNKKKDSKQEELDRMKIDDL